MITITRHIKINPLTVFLFAMSSVFHYPVIFFIAYGAMVLHEVSHAAAAKILRLKTDYIILEPFGLSLKLQDIRALNMTENIILYLSGPAMNIALALVSIFIYRQNANENIRLFYMTNIILFIVNLFPAVPLDGGMIARAVIIKAFGIKRGIKISNYASLTVGLIIGALGIYAFYECGNFTVIMFCALILGNSFLQKRKSREEYIRERARNIVKQGT